MKVFLDTNILLSAALFPNGITAKAYLKAVSYPNNAVVCQWNIDELYRVFHRKFPTRLHALEHFLSLAASSFEIVPTPKEQVADELKIRDINDRPILRAAQNANASILLTGDKDFLESKVKTPTILSPAQFLEL